jgi:hypothetical protein
VRHGRKQLVCYRRFRLLIFESVQVLQFHLNTDEVKHAWYAVKEIESCIANLRICVEDHVWKYSTTTPTKKQKKWRRS